MSPRVALYPGTFDPVTLGHLDVLQRALALFDRVTVLVAAESKAGLFSLEQRLQLLRAAVADLDRCDVEGFAGLLVDEVRRRRPVAVLRGIRSAMDYEHEWSLAGVNLALLPGCEFVFLLARPEMAPLSSTLVREVARHGGDLSRLVPPAVAELLDRRFTDRNG